MTFLLRAALVIGALSYLALARGGADPAARVSEASRDASREASKAVSGGLARGAEALAAALPGPRAAALDAMAATTASVAASVTGSAAPAEPRDRAGRAALARGLMAELSRRAGLEEPGPGEDPPSRDTLEDADRRPAWRGPSR